PLAVGCAGFPSIVGGVNVLIQLVALVGVPDDHPRLVSVFIPAWLFPDQVFAFFDLLCPTAQARFASIIVNVGLPGFAVVSHNVTLEIHVLVTLDWLPRFALATVRDHVATGFFDYGGNF